MIRWGAFFSALCRGDRMALVGLAGWVAVVLILAAALRLIA